MVFKAYTLRPLSNAQNKCRIWCQYIPWLLPPTITIGATNYRGWYNQMPHVLQAKQIMANTMIYLLFCKKQLKKLAK